ncbi:MAG: glycosyltransferase family 2 protein, partial [Weeksellaceae bacterium]|nr:glycosyltransferase family 2 protein [Weeksellaceae bacterium]
MNTTDKNNPSWCVIIPTYNNAKTLQRVIDGVLEYTSYIFIINDGSTDETPEILKNYPQVYLINLPVNKG